MKLPLRSEMAHAIKITVPDGRFKWISYEHESIMCGCRYNTDFTSIRLATVADKKETELNLYLVKKYFEDIDPKYQYTLDVVCLGQHPSFYKTERYRLYKRRDLDELYYTAHNQLWDINDEFWRAGRNDEMPKLTLTLSDDLSVRYKRVSTLVGHLKNEFAHRRRIAKLPSFK
ncbi:MAG: hypothetical protein ABW007_19470 [Chitinophagaceae bacterium]